MREWETRTGGPSEDFPETAWTSVLRAPESPQAKARFHELLGTYWRPVYRYVRASGRRSVEDAKDLTQGFFAHLLQGDLLDRYRPERGRLRHFLKGALRYYLANHQRAELRLKRGVGMAVPLTGALTEELEGHPDRDPAQAFDDQWARDVMSRAVGLLRERLESEGRGDAFRVFEAYELQPINQEAPTYDSVASALGMEPHDVENRLDTARRRLRETLLEVIREYVTSYDDLLEEYRDQLEAGA